MAELWGEPPGWPAADVRRNYTREIEDWNHPANVDEALRNLQYHPQHHVQAVQDAVARQYGRAHPDDNNHDVAVPLITLGILQGKGFPGYEGQQHLGVVNRMADQMARTFIDHLNHGRAERFPVDREMTPGEQSLFAGYPGPWTANEQAQSGPGPKLSPAEHWDLSNSRDIRLMDSFYNSKDAESAGFDPREHALSVHAQTHFPEETLAQGSRHGFPTGEGIIKNVVGNNENPVGRFFTDMNVLSSAARLFGQGETGKRWDTNRQGFVNNTNLGALRDALGDAWKSRNLALQVRRNSPIAPGVSDDASPAERVRALRSAQRNLFALEPLTGGDHAYLTTGKPQSRAQTMGEDLFYDLFDPFTIPTLLTGVAPAVAAAKSQATGGRALMAAMKAFAKPAANELGQEAAESARWTVPEAANIATQSGIGGFTGPDFTGPLNFGERPADEAERQRIMSQRTLDRQGARYSR